MFDANEMPQAIQSDGSLNINGAIGNGVTMQVTQVNDPVDTNAQDDKGNPIVERNIVVTGTVTKVYGSPTRKPRKGDATSVAVGDVVSLWLRYGRKELGDADFTPAIATHLRSVADACRAHKLGKPPVGCTLSIVHDRLGEKNPDYPMRSVAKLSSCEILLTTGSNGSSVGFNAAAVSADDI